MIAKTRKNGGRKRNDAHATSAKINISHTTMPPFVEIFLKGNFKLMAAQHSLRPSFGKSELQLEPKKLQSKHGTGTSQKDLFGYFGLKTITFCFSVATMATSMPSPTKFPDGPFFLLHLCNPSLSASDQETNAPPFYKRRGT